MKLNQLFAFEGVFAAVKCVRCGAIYDASSQDFIGLHGELTLGLTEPLVDVGAPKRPKKALAAVCRTPECMESLVRALLGCDATHSYDGADPDELWQQVLQIWGYQPDEVPSPAPTLRSRSKRR
jgi:hypothetical protein